MAYQSNYTGNQIDAGIQKTTKMTLDGNNVTFIGKLTVTTPPVNDMDVVNKGYLSNVSGLTEGIKQALLQCFQKVAWVDAQGQTYYDALYDALYPPANLISITCVYTQGGTVYDTDTLDSLKSDLVVTAHYDDSSTQTITTYTLSGSLTVGTSTITVTYLGKTTTFDVTVTEDRGIPSQYTWLYDARDGELLSAQNYVSKTSTGTISETILDDILITHVDNNGTQSGSSSQLLTYAFTDTTSTNAVISTRAKIKHTSINGPTYTAIGGNFQLSNGTSGAQVYLESSGQYIDVKYHEGTTIKSISTNYLLEDFHLFELKLQNGHQIFSIDGTQIFDTSTLSTLYVASNRIRLQATGIERCPNGVTIEFDWITYYEVA